jgi:aerobic C4-dicarboxylate transport protein
MPIPIPIPIPIPTPMGRGHGWDGTLRFPADPPGCDFLGVPPTILRQPWYRLLYVQVLIAVLAGILVGHYFPATGIALKPFSDGFIKLVKLVIAPIVFCTVVHGLASMSDLRRLGRVGAKTLLYFEVVSTVALALGLLVVNVLRPGDGFHVDPRTLDTRDLDLTRTYATQSKSLSTVAFLLNLIPNTFLEAFVKGDLLQVLFVAVLTAFALNALGPRGQPVLRGIDTLAQLFFGIMSLVVRVAPLGAFGAMGFTVGQHGIRSLERLAALMGSFYLTAGVFVVVVLGLVARAAGFSLFRLLAYLREELLLVLGTSSSETALPGLLRKLQALGCAPGTVGLVVPTGYSFNLDGTNIYLTMGAVFLAQATDTPLSLSQQLSLLAVAMVSSKGASGVTGAGFIVLAATLAAVPGIPLESLALLVGIDRFMSECRALVNLIGNAVATVVISRWEGELPAATLRERLQGAPLVTPH